jgi:hypothetical protein
MQTTRSSSKGSRLSVPATWPRSMVSSTAFGFDFSKPLSLLARQQ